MKSDIDINTGELNVTREGLIMKAPAIGSCIVIAASDLRSKVYAMVHIMLPGNAPKNEIHQQNRYAVDAINNVIERMISLGANKDNISVCLVGGSNVLKAKDDTICQANINSVLSILEQLNITIEKKDLGGTLRRSLTFDTKSARVNHSVGDGADELLWQFK